MESALESYFQHVSGTILEELDKNNYVGAILIDLNKAFVIHKILLKKLVL